MNRRSLSMNRAGRAWWVIVLVMGFLAGFIVTTMDPPAQAGEQGSPNPGVLPVQAKAYGTTYGELAAEWWIWGVNCPFDQCPIADPDGSFADVDQAGNIWYLAGTLGDAIGSDPVIREFTVPAGKAVYVPLVNQVSLMGEEDEMRQSVNDALDAVTDLYCAIDEVELGDLPGYRAVSKLFDFPITEGSFANVVFGAPVGTYPAVAGAYAVLLPPLPAGEHIIEFGGAKEGEDWQVWVVCLITVVGGDDE